MTIDQKERITRLIACILHNINRADAIADGMPVDESIEAMYVKDITNYLAYARDKVDDLKQYLMEIDNDRKNIEKD